MSPSFEDVMARFQVPDGPVEVDLLDGGHINRSYRISVAAPEGRRRYLLQRLNSEVFPDPAQVMENIERVTSHLGARLESSERRKLSTRTVLRLIRTREGNFYATIDGDCWRLYAFIEGTVIRQSVAAPEEAYQAGLAYGEFLSLLADFPGETLHETIPRFHDTPRRLEELERVFTEDALDRASCTTILTNALLTFRDEASRLVDGLSDGSLPTRVVHNDAKMSNVLLDRKTNAAVCVVDLDTVMPGSALYDFGDMVRSMTCRCPEDEFQPPIEVDLELFEALARGYLTGCGPILTETEVENLVFSGFLITAEQAARFLTDFLAGDVYYPARNHFHNLDRADVALALAFSIRKNREQMEEIIRRLYPRFS